MIAADLPKLDAHHLREALPRVEGMLRECGTLEIPRLENGIYPASGGQGADAASGYQNAWLRDNVMVAYSRWHCGDAQSALETLRSLGTCLRSQLPRMVAIIARPALKQEVQSRPHVRFDARTLGEIPGNWAHAQNDALGAVMWLRMRLASEEHLELDATERELYTTLARYFGAIEYWADEDSGAWEETRKVNSSSIGIVLAALTALQQQPGPLPGLKTSELDRWIREGRAALDRSLPFESPPSRRTDAALLFLIHPYSILDDPRMKDLILSLVRARLMGDHGIRRYIGDSYYCQDYDQWFPPGERSADFSTRLDLRDEFLRPGCEAQWCLFDPILSVIYGRRFRQDGAAASLARQLLHFNRAIEQLTPQGQCTELYYLKGGAWVPNEHTPLAWTQAGLATALHSLRLSADLT
jgi:hypothetical protein